MSGLTITVIALCSVAGFIALLAIVEYIRQRAVFRYERARLLKFEEEIAALKAVLEPSPGYKEKHSDEGASGGHEQSMRRSDSESR